MSSKKIMLLGASGFIGKNLTTRLKQLFSPDLLCLWSSEHDISDKRIIEEIISEKSDVIIIASGKSFVPDSWVSPREFYLINTIGVLNVAEAARISNAKIIFLSTFVYGEPYELPIAEKNSVKAFNPYASSKFAAEQILEDYFRHFGVKSNVLRVFNVYGKGQREEFLIPLLISQYQNGRQINVRDLDPRRDYVHVQDVVSAILAAAEHFKGFEVYNVAGGKSFSVKEVIEVIFAIGEKVIPIITDDLVRRNEVKDTLADVSKMERDFGWKPNVSFQKGIEELMK